MLRVVFFLLICISASATSLGDGAVLTFPRSGPVDSAWHIRRTNVDAAWRLGGNKGEGIIIAMPDTGYVPHPEAPLATKTSGGYFLAPGFDFTSGRADPYDDFRDGDGFLSMPGHGVQPAALIISPAGCEGGERPVTGVAPGVKLIPIKTSHGVIATSLHNLTAGIRHAVHVGAHIISISQASLIPDAELKRAVDDAEAKGVIVVAASGNLFPGVLYPANYPSVIGVGASDYYDRVFTLGTRGAAIDISAPGSRVYTAWVRRDFITGQRVYEVRSSYGTTLSTAQVAGAAALWLAYHGVDKLRARYGAGLTDAFRTVLKRSARTPNSWDTKLDGAGILDAYALLLEPLP